MIDKAFAQNFAIDWIDSWNSHDLDRILSHYSDDFKMSLPVIINIICEPSGMLKGNDKIREYWGMALQSNPYLHFELISVLTGVNSITIYYKGSRGISAEIFYFGADGRVEKAYAHYKESI